MSFAYFLKFNRKFVILLFCLGIFTANFGQSRRKNKADNWFTGQQKYVARWRIGGGIYTGINTGAHLELYNLSDMCSGSICIMKNFSVNLSYSREAVMFQERLLKVNHQTILPANRFSLDLKKHFPFLFNPYVGMGLEGGSREIIGTKKSYNDLVFRLGMEQKITGFKINRQSKLHVGGYLEGKYNHCLIEDFRYFLPVFGIRSHFL